MVKKRVAAIAAACAMCAVLVAGCGSQGSQAKEEAASEDMQAPAQATSAEVAETSAGTSAEAPAAVEPALPVFGTEDAEGTVFALMNKTGQELTALAVKSSLEAEYSENMVPEGVALANNEQAAVYLPRIEGAVSEDSDIQTRALADMLVVLADGAEFELHQLDVYDITEPELRLSGDVAYLEYISAATGETVSTLDAELAWLEAASLEQAAAAEAEAEYYEEGDYYYEEPVYYEEPTYYEGGDAGDAGGEDQCVPDIILR